MLACSGAAAAAPEQSARGRLTLGERTFAWCGSTIEAFSAAMPEGWKVEPVIDERHLGGPWLTSMLILRATDAEGRPALEAELSCDARVARLNVDSPALRDARGRHTGKTLSALLAGPDGRKSSCTFAPPRNSQSLVFMAAEIDGERYPLACPPSRGAAPTPRTDVVEGAPFGMDGAEGPEVCGPLARLGCTLYLTVPCLATALSQPDAATRAAAKAQLTRLCAATRECRSRGACVADCGQCVPATDDHCERRGARECEFEARCDLLGGRCVLDREDGP
jgi:hypothetical protein